MMRLGSPDDTRKMRNALVARFKAACTSVQMRRLTTPGGAVENARIYWVALPGRQGIWAHFWDPPTGRDNRWGCWFGASIGKNESESLVPAVEINLPVDTNMMVAGRVLLDAKDRMYLGHRGGLGGGRGGQYSLAEFSQEIRGFVREEFDYQQGSKLAKAFVIAAFDDTDLIERLHAYVLECVRLRESKRATKLIGAAALVKLETPKFNEEADEDGTGTGVSPHDITRLHGRVVNNLAKLVPGAMNTSHHSMRPDLYVMKSGKMTTLFEVKASSDTQSWFTAMGQLVVYSGDHDPPPKKVFVCPADRKDPSFQCALRRLGIALVIFKVDERGSVQFLGLEDALA